MSYEPFVRQPRYTGGRRSWDSTKMTKEKKLEYIETVRRSGLLSKSAEKIGVSPGTVMSHRKSDPAFDEEVNNAMALFADDVEEELYRRAMEGVQKPIVHRGEVVTHVAEYSDRLLELAVKRHKVEFRDKVSADVNLTGGVLLVPGAEMSVEEWQRRFGGGEEPKE